MQLQTENETKFIKKKKKNFFNIVFLLGPRKPLHHSLGNPSSKQEALPVDLMSSSFTASA